MPRAAWLILLCCVAHAVRADESPEQLVRALHHAKPARRAGAQQRLRELGQRARPALEGYLDPSRQSFPPAPEALRERIARAVLSLGHRDYHRRERARQELVSIGAPAARQLAAVRKSQDLQVRTTAGQILDQLFPPAPAGAAGELPRAQAALLLADVGRRASLPALLHAMQEDTPFVAAAAGFAARAILGGGPEASDREWVAHRSELVALWKIVAQAEEVPIDARAGSVTFPPAWREGERLLAESSMRWWLRDVQTERQIAAEEICRLETRVARGNLLGVTRWLRQHVGRRTESRRGSTRSVTESRNGKRVDPGPLFSRMRARWSGFFFYPIGLAIVLDLPAGLYLSGLHRRFQPRATLRKLVGIEGYDGTGTVVLLGRSGGQASLFVSLTGRVARFDRRIALQGWVIVDAVTGRLVSYRLEGPMLQQWRGERNRGWIVLDWRAAGKPRQHATGDAALDRLLAELQRPEIERRVQAAARIAALGQGAARSLERIVRPPAPAAAELAAIARLIDQVGSPRDLVRQEATLALLARGRTILGSLAEARSRTTDAARRLLLDRLADRVARGDALLVLECIRLLADVGDSRSIPVLRSLLASRNGQHRIAAVAALRALLGVGPAPDVRLWRRDPAAALAPWTALFSKGRVAPRQDAATLQLDPAALRALPGRAESAVQLDRLGPDWLFEPANQAAWLAEVETRARYRVAGGGILLDDHLQQWTHEGRREAPRSWRGRTIALQRASPGKFELRVAGKLYEEYTPLLLPVAPLLLEHLPRGRLERGVRRALSREFVRDLVALLASPVRRPPRLVDGGGWIAFDRPDGALERYRLALRVAASSAGRSWERSWLAGSLLVDAQRRVPVSFELAGPSWGADGDLPLLGQMRLDWRLDRSR